MCRLSRSTRVLRLLLLLRVMLTILLWLWLVECLLIIRRCWRRLKRLPCWPGGPRWPVAVSCRGRAHDVYLSVEDGAFA